MTSQITTAGTAPATEQHPPTARVIRDAEEAVAVATELAQRFRLEAGDRDLTRSLPQTEVEALSEAGLTGITVPREHGGADVSPSVVAEVFRLLGEADPNIAQIPHSHFVYVQLLKAAGRPEQRQFFSKAVLRGARMANAQTERSSPTASQISTVLRRTKFGYQLEGTKYYCTGSLFAHWIPVLARLDDRASVFDGHEFVAYVPAHSPGLDVIDDWDALGQRLTVSGTVTFDHVFVDPGWVIRRAPVFERPHAYGSFAQLLHAAIDVGIARGAMKDAADFVNTRSRPWFEAGVEHASEDPLVVQRFGELYVDVVAAEATLVSAGHTVDEAFRRGTEEACGRASLAVAAAKVTGEKASLEVSSALFEVAGTRSTGSEHNLDRHWRNARTHTLHDPVRWKYQHLGRFALNGTPPPRHSAI